MSSRWQDGVLYSYKDYDLVVEHDFEEDNVKKFHEVFRDEKRIGYMPYSPYSDPPLAVFKMWVDSGMPSYEDMRGQTDKAIHRYYTQWLDRQLDRLLVEEMTDAL